MREEIEVHREAVKELTDSMEELQDKIDSLRQIISARDNDIAKINKQLAAICAKARNQYSKKQIKEDFLNGIQEMSAQAGEASQINEDIDLPVFTISSSDYLKLCGKLKRDGKNLFIYFIFNKNKTNK